MNQLERQPTILDLPLALIFRISSFLPLKSFMTFTSSCKAFYKAEIYSGANYSSVQAQFNWFISQFRYCPVIDAILANIAKHSSTVVADLPTLVKECHCYFDAHVDSHCDYRYTLLFQSLVTRDNLVHGPAMDMSEWILHCYPNPSVCNFLLDRGADINTRDSKYGFSPLIMAIKRVFLLKKHDKGEKKYWIRVIKRLLGQGADLNVRDCQGHDAIAHSAQKSEVEKILLTARAERWLQGF